MKTFRKTFYCTLYGLGTLFFEGKYFNLKNEIRKLNTSQYESENLIKTKLNKKLSALLSFSTHNNTHYKTLIKNTNLKYDERRLYEQIKKFPTLSKRTIKNNYNQLISKNAPKSKKWNTGGSTGEPLFFIRDNEAFHKITAAVFRSWEWTGWKFGDKMYNLWAHPEDLKSSKKLINIIKNYLLNFETLSALDLNKTQLNNYVNKIKKDKKYFLRGYASALYVFAKYITDNKIKINSPQAIISTGDSLYPEYRKTIEKAFGCKVFDQYGGRDSSVYAAECKEHQGYHISIETGFLEIVNKNILITDLLNKSMPFIRYEVGDLGKQITWKKCNCGITLPRIKKIYGRDCDIIKKPNGENLIVHHFTNLFEWFDSINQFQIIQEMENLLVVKLIVNKKFDEKEKKILIKKLKFVVGKEIKINLQIVNKINLSKSGKRRFIISKIKEIK
ncbi:hypothetical protein K9L97_05405 [Candidatus Woesearchaeota archaeon]|nr:hypothetical protein [Candidatus Woesearchaeota archaeon]